MDLAQLSTFCRVYEERSVTQAAAAQHLSQPAVSRQVQALEAELEEVLFTRGGRRLEPTEAGEIVYQHAKRVLRLLDDCRRELANRQGLASGHVAVGAGMTTTILNLPGILASFRRAYPGLDVTIKTGTSATVAAMVMEGEVDVGFVTSPTSPVGDQRLVEKLLFEDEIILVTAPGTPPPGAPTDAADQRATRMLAFPKGSGFREDVEKALAALPNPPRVATELDSVEAIKEMVKVGLGIAYLPRVAVASELQNGLLVQIHSLNGATAGGDADVPTLKRATRLIHRKSAYLSRAASAFVEHVSGLALGST